MTQYQFNIRPRGAWCPTDIILLHTITCNVQIWQQTISENVWFRFVWRLKLHCHQTLSCEETICWRLFDSLVFDVVDQLWISRVQWPGWLSHKTGLIEHDTRPLIIYPHRNGVQCWRVDLKVLNNWLDKQNLHTRMKKMFDVGEIKPFERNLNFECRKNIRVNQEAVTRTWHGFKIPKAKKK